MSAKPYDFVHVSQPANSPDGSFHLDSRMRFIHVADVHLGAHFGRHQASIREDLSAASQDTFERSVYLAIDEEVHAFLIAGDLFDDDRPKPETLWFLDTQFRRLDEHGITVVYAKGNHDPGPGPESIEWSDNVLIVSEVEPRRVKIPGRNGEPVGYVTSAGHPSANETQNLSDSFRRFDSKLPEVGLLHTQVHSSLGAADHHPYAPSELSSLESAGFDYWALGHVHSYEQLSVRPPVVYPGSLQGLTHKEQGLHGALLVDLSNLEDPVVSFKPLATVRWATITVTNLEEVSSWNTLRDRIREEWASVIESAQDSSTEGWMARLILRGACPLWSELQKPETRESLATDLRGDLEGVLDVKVIAEAGTLYLPLDIEEYRDRKDVLGTALQLSRKIRQGDWTLPGLDSKQLCGLGPDAIADYVNDLLEGEGVDHEIAARLLGKWDSK